MLTDNNIISLRHLTIFLCLVAYMKTFNKPIPRSDGTYVILRGTPTVTNLLVIRMTRRIILKN